MSYAPHFTYDEMIFSQYAIYHGIDNTPPPDIEENLVMLSWWLEELRDHVGQSIRVSSGYRCPRVNMGIGGSTSSAHMKGFAADISCRTITPLSLAILAADKMRVTGYDQIIHEFGQWVHCGLATKPRFELLTASLIGGKKVYTKGLM